MYPMNRIDFCINKIFSHKSVPLHVAALIILAHPSLSAQATRLESGKIFVQDQSFIARVNQSPTPGKQVIHFQSLSGPRDSFVLDELDEEVKDIKLGDVDNDGTDEIVVLTRLRFYVYEKSGGRYTLANEKTTELYGAGRPGDPSVVSPAISWAARTPAFVSEEDRSGGRIAIGDVNHDGLNEVVVSKTLLYNQDPQTPFKEFYSAVDILQWQTGGFEVQDTYTRLFGDGSEGVYIEDLDKDGKSELIIARSTDFAIYEFVEDPENYPKQDRGLYMQRGFKTGRYQPIGLLRFTGKNLAEWAQRSCLVAIDDKMILVRVVTFVSSGNTDEVGLVKLFEISPEVMLRLEKGRLKRTDPPSVTVLTTNDFVQSFQPIRLPTVVLKNRVVALVSSLSVGDIDNDGIVEVVVNTPGRALVYRLEEGP